jgi:putative transposase
MVLSLHASVMAESVIGMYKNVCIRIDGQFMTVDELELTTLAWVHWLNEHRLHSSIGYIPPIDYEQTYYRRIASQQRPPPGEFTLH